MQSKRTGLGATCWIVTGLLSAATGCPSDTVGSEDEIGTDSGTTNDTGTGTTDDTSTTGTTDDTTDDTTESTDETTDETTGAAECGNALVEADEECDDGNQSNTDACLDECLLASCGDGLLHEGVEECDSGRNNGPGNACTGECMANVCGDGIPGPGEGCDDGNTNDDDECTNACALASCGDGVLVAGEQCDDGNADENDECLSTCVLASCGDGFVFADLEGCDDGALNSDTAMCTSACAVAYCGDELVCAGVEDCDEGVLNSDTSMCTSICQAASCGDGLVWEGIEVCDDGNADNFDACSNLCAISAFQLNVSQVKRFEFLWGPVVGAEYYQLFESADVGEPFVQIGGNIVDESIAFAMPLHFRINASYELLACNGMGCSAAGAVDVVGTLTEGIGYLKASNTDADARFGSGLAISGDGNTLVVGAQWEDSDAMGIDGDQANDFASDAGAVYVFVRNGLGWSQQAYIKASNTDNVDQFGSNVALSDDGNTLVVAAPSEDSSATGIGGNQADDSAPNSGAAYVFVRSGGVWSQQAYVKASNTGADDLFGSSLALSGSGDTLAIGALEEDSSATGIDGNQANESAEDSGAVYLFVRNAGIWSQQAYIKGSNADTGDGFGGSVALADDGNTLVVGADTEDSGATGVDGNQVDDSAMNSGAVYVLSRSGGVWSQQAYLKASNTDASDVFGASVALADAGNTLVVGAPGEDSNATGIDGDQADDSIPASGAVYVFARNGGVWSQQTYVKASNTGSGDRFGYPVALSGDGEQLAVGAWLERSNATGIDGDQANDVAGSSGAAYVFEHAGAWSQRAYVKASNTELGDHFGFEISLSDDANTLAVSADYEDSSAMGIGGDPVDDTAPTAGAVYLY